MEIECMVSERISPEIRSFIFDYKVCVDEYVLRAAPHSCLVDTKS